MEPVETEDVGLERALVLAETAFPGLKLERAEFRKHLARHAREVSARALEQLHLGDLYLAFGAGSGHAGAVLEFHARCLSELDDVLRRFRRGPEFTAEVRQRVVERLLLPSDGRPARLLAYAGRGSLRSWVATAARRLALDLLEQEQRHRPLADALADRLETVSLGPEAELLKAKYRGRVEAALRSAVRSLAARDRQVLFMHLAGASFSDIGKVRGVDKSTVFHWFRKIRASLRDAVASDALGSLTPSELESVVRLVQSQVELGLSEAGSSC